MHLRPHDWLRIRRELTFLAFAAMEMCWFTPWYRALTPGAAATPPASAYSILLGFVLASMSAARAMHALRIKMRLQRGVLAGLLFVSLLVGLRWLLYRAGSVSLSELATRPIRSFSDAGGLIPEELVVALGVLFCWWRGLRLAAVGLSPARAGFALRFGVVAFVLFILLNTLSTGEDPTPFVPPFFLAGLVALGLTRVESLREVRGGMRTPFGAGWLGFLGGAALVIVLAGAWAAAALGGEAPRLALRWLTPVGYVLFALALVLLSPLLLLMELLIRWLMSRMDLRAALRGLGVLGSLVENLQAWLDGLLRPAATLAPDWSRARLLFYLTLLLLIMLGVIRTLRRPRRRVRLPEDEAGESLLSASAVLASLGDMLKAGLSGLGEAAGLLGRFGAGRDLLAALTIRRIYARTARLSANLGYPRSPAETPFEFQPTLGRAFPGLEAEIGMITQAYVGVHYGELPEDQAGLESVRAAWQAVRRSGSERRRGRSS